MSEKNWEGGGGGWGVTVFVWEILLKISQNWTFLPIFRGEPGASFYKSWLKSNKFQSFWLILPIVNWTL